MPVARLARGRRSLVPLCTSSALSKDPALFPSVSRHELLGLAHVAAGYVSRFAGPSERRRRVWPLVAFQPKSGGWTPPRVRPAWCLARRNEAQRGAIVFLLQRVATRSLPPRGACSGGRSGFTQGVSPAEPPKWRLHNGLHAARGGQLPFLGSNPSRPRRATTVWSTRRAVAVEQSGRVVGAADSEEFRSDEVSANSWGRGFVPQLGLPRPSSSLRRESNDSRAGALAFPNAHSHSW